MRAPGRRAAPEDGSGGGFLCPLGGPPSPVGLPRTRPAALGAAVGGAHGGRPRARGGRGPRGAFFGRGPRAFPPPLPGPALGPPPWRPRAGRGGGVGARPTLPPPVTCRRRTAARRRGRGAGPARLEPRSGEPAGGAARGSGGGGRVGRAPRRRLGWWRRRRRFLGGGSPGGGAAMEAGCTKLCQQKPLNLKDDNTEKHCPVTVNPWHMKNAFKVLNELRSQSLLCDVTIVAEDMEIAAHRVVLAACSSYFHAMFTGEMSESLAKKIQIKEVDSSALKMLVEYVYTGEIIITEENVQALLPAASLLQLEDVKKSCCDFLETQLHPINCLGIQAFADMHACTELLNKANTYAEQHFTEVVLGEEFLGLGVEQVCSLISSDKLTVASEEKVFEAVIAWVNYDKDVRQELMARLMEHVRLPLLSKEYLVQRVEEEILVKNSSACKDYLIEAMKYHLLPLEQRALMKSKRTKLRTPSCFPKLMVVVGGQAPKAIRSVECYDFKEERWHQVAELPSRRCRAGVAHMNGLVFAVGGFNGSLRVRTVDSYDPAKDRWTSVACMQDRRSTLGAAVLNGLLYAVGGFDGSTGLSSVEAYNMKTNEWFHVAPMNTRRSSVGVGVIGGMLYAVGGYDGALRQCLSTVECYSYNSNEWTHVADMSTRRSGAGVGVLNNLLYAVGGHDGPLVRKSVEVYDPAINVWKQVADMNVCRRNAGVSTVNGFLYVIGGDDGSRNLATVEYYNPTTDKWTFVSSCMSTGRSYAGVTVIDKPL